jgi:hypothetical protein
MLLLIIFQLWDQILARGCSCYVGAYNIVPRIINIKLWGFIALTLKEEHRLKVFENRLLRRIFGPKRDLVASRVVLSSI